MNVMNMATSKGIVTNSRRATRKERKEVKPSPCDKRSRRIRRKEVKERRSKRTLLLKVSYTSSLFFSI